MKIKKDKSEYLNNKTRFVTKLRCCMVLSTFKGHCLLTAFVLCSGGRGCSALVGGLCVSVSTWLSVRVMMTLTETLGPSSSDVPYSWWHMWKSGDLAHASPFVEQVSSCQACIYLSVKRVFVCLFTYQPTCQIRYVLTHNSYLSSIIIIISYSLMFPFGTKTDYATPYEDL